MNKNEQDNTAMTEISEINQIPVIICHWLN